MRNLVEQAVRHEHRGDRVTPNRGSQFIGRECDVAWYNDQVGTMQECTPNLEGRGVKGRIRGELHASVLRTEVSR